MLSKKFLARANMRKYYDVLVGTLKTPQEPDDGTPESNEEIKARLAKYEEVKIKNNTGYMELLIAHMEDIGFAIKYEGRTTEFPGRDPTKA